MKNLNNSLAAISKTPVRKCRFDSGSFKNAAGVILGWNNNNNTWEVALADEPSRVIPVLPGQLRPLKTVVSILATA